jgi:hypothetical protein
MSVNLDGNLIFRSMARQADASGGESVSGGSGETPQLQEIAESLKSLKGELETVKRIAQGDKDRAVKKVEGELRKLIDEWEQAKATGVSADDFTFRKEMADFMAEVRGQRATPTPSAPAGGVVNRELQDIDDLLDLPANDPRVTNLHLQYGHDTTAYKAQAKALKASFNQAAPTPAELPATMQGVATTRQPTDTALQTAYEKERDAIAAKGLPRDERVRALSELKMSYAAKGLPLL